MAWQHEDEDAANTYDADNNPSGWTASPNDDERWKMEAQRELDKETEFQSPASDATPNSIKKNQNNTERRKRTVSVHYIIQSTKQLNKSDSNWILCKSLFFWFFLMILTPWITFSNSFTIIIQTGIAITGFCTYFILLIFWCLFFRLTASASIGGFYPFIGDCKSCVFHLFLFLIGLGGVDLYFLNNNQTIMRECYLQYKVLEFCVFLFVYFFLLSLSTFEDKVNIEYIISNPATLILTIPMFLFVIDSMVHYSIVYHSQYWKRQYKINMKIIYAFVLLILCLDVIVRSLLFILFTKVSLIFIVLFIAFYVFYVICIWMYAITQSMGSLAPFKHFKLTMKKSGGKLIGGVLLSFWSICGLFQILPTMKSSSLNIQKQQEIQVKWGKNILRFECFIRLLLSLVLFTKYYIFDEDNSSNDNQVLVYSILIIFVIYPYCIECLFQSPLHLFCRGSFFMIHHIDTLTSLPNLFRLNKDLKLNKLSWKLGVVIMNVVKMRHLNKDYGRKCGDDTLIKFMQRILFEIEENTANGKVTFYRINGDRFAIFTNITDKEDFEEFVKNLAKIKITVLRPPDFDGNDDGYNDDDGDADGDDYNANDDQKEAANDDFINPENASAGGGYGDTNWYEDDDGGDGDNKNENVAHLSDGDGDGAAQMKDSEKPPKVLRKVSVFNRETANESLVMRLRIAASFGAFCKFEHVVSLDNSLKESLKNDENDDNFLIGELQKQSI